MKAAQLYGASRRTVPALLTCLFLQFGATVFLGFLCASTVFRLQYLGVRSAGPFIVRIEQEDVEGSPVSREGDRHGSAIGSHAMLLRSQRSTANVLARNLRRKSAAARVIERFGGQMTREERTRRSAVLYAITSFEFFDALCGEAIEADNAWQWLLDVARKSLSSRSSERNER